MQEYLSRTQLGAAMDRLGSTLLILFSGMAVFLALWGLRLSAVIAGAAAGVMLLVLRESTRKQRLKRREDALRRRIGGELKMEQWLLMQPRRAHFEAALLLSQAYELLPEHAGEEGTVCRMKESGERILVFCAQMHRQERLSVRDVAAFQRLCLKEKAARGIVCGAGGVSEAGKQQAALSPVIRMMDYERMIALAGAVWPATDEQLIELGRRKQHGRAEKTLVHTALDPGRARNYLIYGLLLCALYLLLGFRAYLWPGCICLILMALCRANRKKDTDRELL